MDCTVENRKQIKLDMVVNAAIVDLWEDSGKMYQRANFAAARGLKKMYIEALPKLKHKVWLTVNPNTHTATLPLDFDELTFLGLVDANWHKHPLKLNTQITDTKNIIDIPCEDKCPKCQQDTGICNDLVITEDTEIVVINDVPYNKTIVKKLYPNGDYYLETTTPVLNIDTDEIEYPVKKEFIVNFSLLPCGCLEADERNTANLQTYCPEIYCNYYAPCSSTCNTSYGGYKIFEESGLIQMDESYPFEKVYMEYNGFIMKIKGQYYVPMVSFETLVEWTKWKLIQNRRNYTIIERDRQFGHYVRERRNMEKILGRISLSQIIQSISLLPKFDIDFGYDYYGCFSSSTVTVPATSSNLAAAASINSGGSGGSGSGASCSTVNNNYITINNNGGYTLAVQVNGNPGEPVAGASTYQNNLLIGASNIPYIILAKQILTFADGDYTVNFTTGVVDISPNIFITGDSLIINYDKA